MTLFVSGKGAMRIAAFLGCWLPLLAVATPVLAGDPLPQIQPPFWSVPRVVLAMGGLTGVVFFAMLVCRNVTVGRLKRALAESETLFKDIAETASDRFWEMDENLLFKAHRDVRHGIIDPPPEIFTGRTRWEIAGVDPDDDENWRRHRDVLMARRPFRDFEYAITHEGAVTHLSISGSPIFDDTGAFKGYRGSATNITKRKQAEATRLELENHFKTIVENAPLAITLKDKDGRVLLSNKTHAAWTGNNSSDVLGKTTHEIHSKTLADDVQARDRRALETGENSITEMTYTGPDGNTRDLLSHKCPVKSDGGEIIALATILTDITEQKQAVEQRLQTEKLYRGYFELGLIGMATTSLEKGWIQINDRLCEILGYPQGELVKLTWADITHPDDLEADVTEFNRVLAGEIDGYALDKRFIRKDGEVIHASISAKCVRKEDGAIDHFVALVQDVTDRHRSEEARDKALREAEQANQAKSEFLATMSHELRTPLNAILGFADILSHQYFGPPGAGKYQEYAEDIHASGEHLLELVNEILDLSTVEAGKQSIFKEGLSTRDIIRECVKIVEDNARSKGIDLSTKVPNGLPLLYADKRASKQILLNLLSNAVKFTPEGGSIKVSAESSRHNTTLRITDTGKGIPAELLPNLTDPFTRVDADPYLAEQGWGLGLSIAKSLVELHDGTLDIQSAVGLGTTVTVALPNGISIE